MPRQKRSEQFVATEVCIVHCIQRCVRRAFLAGKDAITGRNFDYRREWIRRRFELLAATFGIDVLTYSILSNHFHVVLRNRPDVVKNWPDEEVALRWLKLFPGRLLELYLGNPTEAEVQELVADRKKLQEVRQRLSDISWFMRSLSEPIARQANKEDNCKGHFWEGRFKAQRITDEAGLLACSMYVDLNPVRAALATSLETSRHTSAYDRLQTQQGKQVLSAAYEAVPISLEEAAKVIQKQSVAERKAAAAARHRVKARSIAADGWLAPLSFGSHRPSDPLPSATKVRASDRGFLSLKLSEYLQLLSWTAKNKPSKGANTKMPSEVQVVLKKLGMDGTLWRELVWNFKRLFRCTAGKPESLKADAERRGRRWSHGQRAVARCFAQTK